MRHLFNALKEHWQIYLGLFLGLIIGLLVGVGFADWKSLVKAFDSKVTDWISSLSTLFGVLIAVNGIYSWKRQKEPEAISDLITSIDVLYVSFLKLIDDIVKKSPKTKSSHPRFQEKIIQSIILEEIKNIFIPFGHFRAKYKLFLIIYSSRKDLSSIKSTYNDIRSNLHQIYEDSKLVTEIFYDLFSPEKQDSAYEALSFTNTTQSLDQLGKTLIKLNQLKKDLMKM